MSRIWHLHYSEVKINVSRQKENALTKISQKQLEKLVEHYETFIRAITPLSDGYEFHDEPDLIAMIETIQENIPNVSTKTIRREILTLTETFYNEKASISTDVLKEALNVLIDELKEKIITYTAYVPIQGLDIETDSLELGGFTIYASHTGPLHELLIDDDSRWLPPYFSAKSYVATKPIQGDANYISEQAYQVAETVVHILNFYQATIAHRLSGQLKISLTGTEVVAEKHHIFYSCEVVSDTGETTRRRGFSGKILDHNSWTINQALIEHWKSHHLDKVILCFETPTPSEIQSRIRRAIIWYSKGINGNNSDEQILALVTALETLLIGNEQNDTTTQGSISQRLAERVAFLLGRNLEERINFHTRAKKIYDLRSKIVHQGKDNIPTIKNLLDANKLAADTIMAFIGQNFNNWTKFLKWIEKQRYSVIGDSENQDNEEIE